MSGFSMYDKNATVITYNRAPVGIRYNGQGIGGRDVTFPILSPHDIGREDAFFKQHGQQFGWSDPPAQQLPLNENGENE